MVFTDAEPVWAASAVAMVVVPLLSRAIEFLVHWIAGTPELLVGVLVSLAFSAVSNPLTLFAMRRGALVVGTEDEDSFARDLVRLPRIAYDGLPFAASEEDDVRIGRAAVRAHAST